MKNTYNSEVLETLIVFNEEIKNNTLTINETENEKYIVNEITSIVNTYTDYTNITNGKISGYSLNNYKKDTLDIYVSRNDEIFLPDGNISVHFCFDEKITDVSKLPTLKVGSKLTLIPTYKSGLYKNKNIEVILEVFEEYKTYKIIIV